MTADDLLALRVALRRAFDGIAVEAMGAPNQQTGARDRVLDVEYLLVGLGQAGEDAYRAEAEAYFAETGRCPWCGELGEYHAPTRWPAPAPAKAWRGASWAKKKTKA